MNDPAHPSQADLEALVAAAQGAAPRPGARNTGEDDIDQLLQDLSAQQHGAPGSAASVATARTAATGDAQGNRRTPSGMHPIPEGSISGAYITASGGNARSRGAGSASRATVAMVGSAAAQGILRPGTSTPSAAFPAIAALSPRTREAVLPGTQGATLNPGTMQPSPRLGLSKDDLDALVAKHTATGVVAETDLAEAMISQDDIDSLVEQLGAVTGSGKSHRVDRRRLTAVLTRHQDTIGALIDHPATAAAPSRTPPAAAPVRAPVLAGGGLLVLALGFCLGLLVRMHQGTAVLVTAIRAQAAANRESTADDALDLKAALGYLDSSDPVDSARGEVLLRRLKQRHPGQGTSLNLILARHYRQLGDDRRAAESYGEVFDHNPHPLEDPSIAVDYVRSLMAIGDRAEATRQVYALLSDEASFLDGHDPQGHLRPASVVARNRAAVATAYVLLGRLLAPGTRTASPGSPVPVTAPGAAP